MIAKPQRAMLLLTLSFITACGASEPPKPVVETQTNEQGCVRVRSTDPQNPAAIPVPIKQACVGPYLLELPQNYFYNQMGTEFDGSFALALEYPSLEPFKPGERSNLSVDVATRTVSIDVRYIDRIDIKQAMRNSYTPMAYQQGDPAETLSERTVGEPIFDLTPYYVDMSRVRTYLKAKGLSDEAPGMQDDWYTDWFIARGESGEVVTIIKCTPRSVTDNGMGFDNGKLVKKKGHPVAECNHLFALADHATKITLNYARVGLPDWQHIEDRARSIFLSSIRGSANAEGAGR